MFPLSFLSLGSFKDGKTKPQGLPTPTQLHENLLGRDGGRASVVLTSSSGNSNV